MLAFASRSRRSRSATVSVMEGHRVKFVMITPLNSLRSEVEGLVFELIPHPPCILRERGELHWWVDAYGNDDVNCSLDAYVGHPIVNFDPDQRSTDRSNTDNWRSEET